MQTYRARCASGTRPRISPPARRRARCRSISIVVVGSCSFRTRLIFTPVCTSEFVALAKAAPQFEELDCALLGLSVDSLYSHVAWLRAIKDVFGVEVPFPVVEDPSMAVGYAYGMLDEQAGDASAVRATYFIDPEGIIRALNWYPMNVGRSVDEMLRTVRALQRSADGQAYTPADWQPGDDVLLPPALPCSAGADWFHQLKADR